MDFRYRASSLVAPLKLRSLGATLHSYTHHLRRVSHDDTYTSPEGSLYLPFDRTLRSRVHRMVRQKVTKELKTIIVVGIGGSNLGTKAIYDALEGFLETIPSSRRKPRLYWAETTDSKWMHKLSQYVCAHTSPKQFLINIISKSGSTTETSANAEYIFSQLTNQFGSGIFDRFVVTSDEGSPLWNQAIEKKIAVLPIPKCVGGRFSVFSTVGLFPLAAAGININQLLEGAQNIIKQCLDGTHSSNSAGISASVLFYQYHQKKNIHDTFFFHPELESLGKWYRQLLGESIGKSEDVGITPTISLGSTDLHSVGQLYLGGPRDKITTFVHTLKSSYRLRVPRKMFLSTIESISGKEFHDIHNAIYQGALVAYKKRSVPYMENILSDISPRSLGEWLQFKMLEIIYLAKLFTINAFDQPQVELYKKETKRILDV